MNDIHNFSKKNNVDHTVQFQILQPGDMLFACVEASFSDRINALYARRCTTLQKLKQQGDRSCEIMFVNQKPADFLIYKKALQQNFGFNNAFALKTLFVFNFEKNVRRGLGSLLFDRAALWAQEKKPPVLIALWSKTMHP